MAFFDDKEEILSIELTQYGKYLLGNAKFNPKYYAFYDDDILYDSRYGNVEEIQNATQPRILEETAYFRTQPDNISIGNEFSLKNEIFTSNYNLNKKPKLNDKTLLNCLGTSDFNSEYAPAWNINIYSGSIDTDLTTTGSIEPLYYKNNSQTFTFNDFINIPQIVLKTNICTIRNSQINSDYLQCIGSTDADLVFYSSKDIVNYIHIEEKNVSLAKENYMIEVFMEETINEKIVYTPLHFYKTKQEIKNNILLDQPLYEDISFGNDKYAVETYFSISLDDSNILESEQEFNFNLYTTTITKEDGCE